MALEEEECRDCQGRGVDQLDDTWELGEREFTCLTCWGAGSIEVQRGPR